MCLSAQLPPLPPHMCQLPELTIKAILRDWKIKPQEYHPPYTDVEKWIDSIESLCNLYGIPDIQWLQCATVFIKEEIRQALVEVLKKFEVVYWHQFKPLLVEFDGKRDSIFTW